MSSLVILIVMIDLWLLGIIGTSVVGLVEGEAESLSHQGEVFADAVNSVMMLVDEIVLLERCF